MTNRMRTLVWAVFVVALCVFTTGCKRGRDPVPWDAIDHPAKKNAKFVVKNFTIKYQLKDVVFPGNEKIHEYLLDRLPLTARIVRALRLKNYHAEKLADGRIFGTNKNDLEAHITELFKDLRRRVYFVEGRYTGKTFKNLTSSAVMVWDYKNISHGRVSNSATVFVYVDQKHLRAISKILKVFLGRLIKKKLSEVVEVTRVVSLEISKSPLKVYQAMRDISPNTRVRFSKEEIDEFNRMFLEPRNSEKVIDK